MVNISLKSIELDLMARYAGLTLKHREKSICCFFRQQLAFHGLSQHSQCSRHHDIPTTGSSSRQLVVGQESPSPFTWEVCVMNSTIVLWCKRRVCSILDSELRCLSRLPNGARAHVRGAKPPVVWSGDLWPDEAAMRCVRDQKQHTLHRLR